MSAVRLPRAKCEVILTEHAVRLRTANVMSFSQPADFVLETGWPVDRVRMFHADVSPYCFDFKNRMLFCVSTPDIAGATFFYQAQRQMARSVIKIPFDALPEPPESPTLIFSIGRCGSTLLYKSFEAAGVRTVSEPDYFTQAALSGLRNEELQSLIGRVTQLLSYPVIKLRSECNYASLLIAGAFRKPNVMFVLRNPGDWAASLHRLSRRTWSPKAIAVLLRAHLAGLDELAQHYDVRICYYEDFRRLTARYVNGLLAWMGSDARLRPAMATELARKDAQEGRWFPAAQLGTWRTILPFARPSIMNGENCGRWRLSSASSYGDFNTTRIAIDVCGNNRRPPIDPIHMTHSLR